MVLGVPVRSRYEGLAAMMRRKAPIRTVRSLPIVVAPQCTAMSQS